MMSAPTPFTDLSEQQQEACRGGFRACSFIGRQFWSGDVVHTITNVVKGKGGQLQVIVVGRPEPVLFSVKDLKQAISSFNS